MGVWNLGLCQANCLCDWPSTETRDTVSEARPHDRVTLGGGGEGRAGSCIWSPPLPGTYSFADLALSSFYVMSLKYENSHALGPETSQQAIKSGVVSGAPTPRIVRVLTAQD